MDERNEKVIVKKNKNKNKTNNLKLFEQSFFSERTHFLKEIKSYDFFKHNF